MDALGKSENIVYNILLWLHGMIVGTDAVQFFSALRGFDLKEFSLYRNQRFSHSYPMSEVWKGKQLSARPTDMFGEWENNVQCLWFRCKTLPLHTNLALLLYSQS